MLPTTAFPVFPLIAMVQTGVLVAAGSMPSWARRGKGAVLRCHFSCPRLPIHLSLPVHLLGCTNSKALTERREDCFPAGAPAAGQAHPATEPRVLARDFLLRHLPTSP